MAQAEAGRQCCTGINRRGCGGRAGGEIRKYPYAALPCSWRRSSSAVQVWQTAPSRATPSRRGFPHSLRRRRARAGQPIAATCARPSRRAGQSRTGWARCRGRRRPSRPRRPAAARKRRPQPALRRGTRKAGTRARGRAIRAVLHDQARRHRPRPALARSIAQAHGGDVRYVRTASSTRFELLLPRASDGAREFSKAWAVAHEHRVGS